MVIAEEGISEENSQVTANSVTETDSELSGELAETIFEHPTVLADPSVASILRRDMVLDLFIIPVIACND